jgi:NAD(P)-dependent dehydrogenase (short-subunit alcohol dehydrogenase family)
VSAPPSPAGHCVDGAAPRSILVTGAASGIGRATTLLFAERGWRVLACDRHPQALQEVANAGGAAVHAIVGDLGTREGARAMVQAAVDAAGGRLDCLFNCAGLLAMGPHASIDPRRIDELIDVNAKGVVHCIDAALPALRATPGAHIVTMCSTSAEYGTPDLAVYSATKFFVRGLTEALNIEFEPLGIQVSAVLVSFVKTPMVTAADVKARSIDIIGVKADAQSVARTVWRAAHGNRTLWRVGKEAVAMGWAVRLLGGGARFLMRRVSGY